MVKVVIVVKVVIDGQSVMEQSRMSTRTRNAGTRMLEHECWNTNAGTQMLEHE
jgi:hypothetical protein